MKSIKFNKARSKATARYFYGLNNYSAILLQKLKFLKPFLNFFALGSNILMSIFDLSKCICQMLYHKDLGQNTCFFVEVLHSRYLDHRSIEQAPFKSCARYVYIYTKSTSLNLDAKNLQTNAALKTRATSRTTATL